MTTYRTREDRLKEQTQSVSQEIALVYVDWAGLWEKERFELTEMEEASRILSGECVLSLWGKVEGVKTRKTFMRISTWFWFMALLGLKCSN